MSRDHKHKFLTKFVSWIEVAKDELIKDCTTKPIDENVGAFNYVSVIIQD